MKATNYFGDDRLRYRVVYSKDGYKECIYCEKEADTREHIPSKVFLNRPFPEHLSTLPACKSCNNSYSHDELFVSLLIQLLKQKYYGSNYSFSNEVNSRIENKRNIETVKNIKNVINTGELNVYQHQVSRVLTKLAIGHAVWEIFGEFCIEDVEVTSDTANISYAFLNELSQKEVDEFFSYFDITNQVLPEVGCRAYEHILVLEQDGEEPKYFLDWVEVQESEYLYTCYRFGDEIIVKIAINSFLFAKVILRESNS
ncbi:hypothetical protein Q5W88_16305 [Shouchella clausii]|uniref:hypothetical protein n=1 Tax=Shouchella clausii TaxID=79880 RepID=UPI0026F40E10|nr:hypothetical protein [Shouchella clausii]MDO7284684.1 hypothetical protein [Shouchella clausii]MDO7304779.1 hypothetical protein [Shouchella clausii]